MRFCDVCDNMLYLVLQPTSTKLSFRCKNCGFSTEACSDDVKACALGRNYVDDEVAYSQYLNPDIKHDPTLPHVNHIVCPNTACTRPADADNDVLYIKYDGVRMKYLYHCCHCSAFWRSEK